MSTWEGRMAARAAERQAVAEAEDYLREVADDPHGTHHHHLIGSMVRCSCGADLGTTCVVLPAFETAEEYDAWFASLSCHLCGEKGVAGPPVV